MRLHRYLCVFLLAGALLVGCGGEEPPAELTDVYRHCGSLRFDGPADEPLVLAPIPDDVAVILDAEIDRIGADDLTTDQVQWYLASRTDERISVGFKRPTGDTDSYTEGHLNLTDDGWRGGGWGPCEIRFAADGKQSLRWELDAPIEPAPSPPGKAAKRWTPT